MSNDMLKQNLMKGQSSPDTVTNQMSDSKSTSPAKQNETCIVFDQQVPHKNDAATVSTASLVSDTQTRNFKYCRACFFCTEI